LRTGSYAMATAEHREPCDSRGSCTVLGAPGGESPPGDSTTRHPGRLVGTAEIPQFIGPKRTPYDVKKMTGAILRLSNDGAIEHYIVTIALFVSMRLAYCHLLMHRRRNLATPLARMGLMPWSARVDNPVEAIELLAEVTAGVLWCRSPGHWARS